MYLVRAEDDRTRICTSSAVRALAHVHRLTGNGLSPQVTDFSGKALAVADLKRRVPLAGRPGV